MNDKVVIEEDTSGYTKIEDLLQILLQDQANKAGSTASDMVMRAGPPGRGRGSGRRGSSRGAARGQGFSSFRGGRGGGSSGGSSQSQLECSICLNQGHVDTTCFYTHPDIAPEAFKRKYPDEKARKSALLLRKAENVSRKNNEERRKQSGDGTDKTFMVSTCLPTTAVINEAMCLPSDSQLVNSGLSAAQMKAIPWYIDSCSSLTLDHDIRDFEDLNYSSRRSFRTANGQGVNTTAKGTVRIASVGVKEPLVIPNAYYCPEVSANLISFGQLARNNCNSTTIALNMTIFDPDFNPILFARCEDDVFIVNSPGFVAATTSRGAPLSTWHKRLGHTNYKYIEKISDRIDIVGKDKPFCELCVKGKQHRVHSKEPATHRTDMPGERWHVDLVGGQNTLKDMQGFNMSAILTDDATHRRFSYPVKTRDQAALKIQEHTILAEAQYGYICKQLHSDDDSIFKSIEPWLTSRGIKREPSAPYAQDQDGIAERSIRTLIEKARTMRIQAGLPAKLWTYILNAAAYLDALVPSSSLPQGKTPYQLYEGEMPDYSQLRVFGCTAYILDYQAKSHGKLAARSHAGVLVGYTAKNQWLIWDGKSVKVRRDVVFDENDSSSSSSIHFRA